MSKNYILFEHETKQILENFQSRDSNDKKFIELDNYLKKITTYKTDNVFFRREKENDSDKQKILELNWKNYSISASQYAGVIQTSWGRITILPKIFSNNPNLNEERLINKASNDLMYFLGYAYNFKTSDVNRANLSKNKNFDFLEMFIFLFGTKTLEVLEHNFYCCYENIEEDLGFIKGKILIKQQLKENTIRGRNDRVYCRYEMFQENNIFNQMIKYVTNILFKKCKNLNNKALLRKILHILNDIDSKTFIATDTEKIVLNSTQREFTPIVNYCRLFLENSLIKFNQGSTDIFCFLIDMNALFEKFVAGFLKENFQEWEIESQKSDKYVAENTYGKKVFQMRHDIFLTKNRETIILDSKYKATDFSDVKGGISQNDVYQMVTYGIRRKCSKIILLYPKYSGDNTVQRIEYFIEDEFSKNKLNLSAIKLDLTDLKDTKKENDEEIKRQLQEIFK